MRLGVRGRKKMLIPGAQKPVQSVLAETKDGEHHVRQEPQPGGQAGKDNPDDAAGTAFGHPPPFVVLAVSLGLEGSKRGSHPVRVLLGDHPYGGNGPRNAYTAEEDLVAFLTRGNAEAGRTLGDRGRQRAEPFGHHG